MATDSERAHVRTVLDVAVSLAEVLVSCGAGAADAATSMSVVASAYDVHGTDADITFTMLSLTWIDPVTHESISRRKNVLNRGLDYARLTETTWLAMQIAEKGLPVGEARERLRAITSAAPRYTRRVQRLGWSTLGAGAAILLGGSWFIAIFSFFAAGCLDALMGALARREVPLFFQCLVGGSVGPIAATVAHVIDPKAPAWLVAVATIIMLLAGVTTLAAGHDLLSGLYVTGVARFTEAVVVTVGIATGLVGATKALDSVGVPLDILSPGSQMDSGTLVRAVGASLIMVSGFALGTHVPLRAFWAVGLLGGIGQLIFQRGVAADLGPVWSSAGAAILIGATSSFAGRLTRMSPLAIIVPGMVPLLPGFLLFNGLISLIGKSPNGILEVAGAAAVACALASGALLGQYLVQLAWGGNWQRRLVSGPLLAIPGRLGIAPHLPELPLTRRQSARRVSRPPNG